MWIFKNIDAVASLIQVKYKANTIHMAAVICNCLREERRILSTASMQEQVLPTQMWQTACQNHIYTYLICDLI